VDNDLLPPTTRAVTQAHATLSALREMLSTDSPLQSKVDQTLEETDATMQELRALAGYLRRHPDSLLRGRRPDLSDQGSKP